ncbi:MAG: hypothetical protein AAFR90_15095 [Pseudomonadota bacterium]
MRYDACQKVFVPGCYAAFDAHAFLARSGPEEIAGDVFDGGKVGRCIVLADAAFSGYPSGQAHNQLFWQ